MYRTRQSFAGFWKVDAAILTCELVVGAPFPTISCSILFALNILLSLTGLFHTQAGYASRDQRPFFSSLHVNLLFVPTRSSLAPFSSVPNIHSFNIYMLSDICFSAQLDHIFWARSSALLPSTHILDVSPELLWCGNLWHRGSNATFQLCPREFAPSLLQCDRSAGPLVGE